MVKQIILLFIILFYTSSVLSLWDYAVTTKSKILFYDDNWRKISSSAHQFDQLSAIAFDEAEEVIYFNDQWHNNGSIFSLKLPMVDDTPHIIEKVVQRTQNESISGIAYDPLNQTLYWTDSRNRKIYYISMDSNEQVAIEPKVLVDFASENSLPDGIALDICRRKLYWTNSNFKNASIEMIDLDGSNRRLIVQSGLYSPHGIVVDQISDRIYWVVDQQGIHFTVESAALDGSQREVIVKGLDNSPFNLAVAGDTLYWTDNTYNAVWMHPKSLNSTVGESADDKDESKPKKAFTFTEKPRGIVARTHMLSSMLGDEHCVGIIQQIRNRLLTPKPTRDPFEAQLMRLRREFCLNGGEYSTQSGMCVCGMGFKGARCEINECHNYCVHGTCLMSTTGFPKCTCQKGFYGERCQSFRCTRFCLNDGLCSITENGEPTCECRDNFGGQRCEHNSTEICSFFCRILKHEPETYVPFGCHEICEELAQENESGHELYAIPSYPHLQTCQINKSNTVIIVLVVGVVLCLALVVLLVHGLRRFYKPARPRIKKTYVVRTQPTSCSDTPLTNRPVAEQCEITIENCCNMNICDTPCFDPKLVVQQSLTREGRSKEDKKMLIPNMEEDLY